MTTQARGGTFYGWRVVGAAFVLGAFGWGMGFFGPPVFLSVVREARGWPLVAGVGGRHACISWSARWSGRSCRRLHRRFGAAAVTKAGALCLAAGILGWATATAPWQLFVATRIQRRRLGRDERGGPQCHRLALVRALAARSAGHGLQRRQHRRRDLLAAVGGRHRRARLSRSRPRRSAPSWRVTMWVLADAVFSRTPQQMGLTPDGDAPGAPPASVTSPTAQPLPGALLWRDRRFLTLAAGMALGLFAQIGLVAHLFSLLVPALGAQRAGLAMGAGDGARDRRPHAARLGDAAGRRQAAGGVLRLCAAARGLARAARRRRHQRAAAAARRGAVRRRLRQRDLAAAPHRPGRVRQGGRAARRRPHRRHLAGRLRLCARRVRPDPRARTQPTTAAGAAPASSSPPPLCRRWRLPPSWQAASVSSIDSAGPQPACHRDALW